MWCSIVHDIYIAIGVGEEDEVRRLGPHDMLKKELEWLRKVEVPPPPCHAFQTLLAGHLHLCRVLFSFERVELGEERVELGE